MRAINAHKAPDIWSGLDVFVLPFVGRACLMHPSPHHTRRQEQKMAAPIYEMSSALALLHKAEQVASAFAPGMEFTRYAREAGYLRSMVIELCRERDAALAELQVALNNVCNGYVDDGNASRVELLFGLRLNDECDEPADKAKALAHYSAAAVQALTT